LPDPDETATWRRDSGERRDDLLRLSSTGRQNRGVERPEATGCEVRSEPRLSLARLRDLRAHLMRL
jgi:hypothetical protein